jgi:serine/threonine protein kinase
MRIKKRDKEYKHDIIGEGGYGKVYSIPDSTDVLKKTRLWEDDTEPEDGELFGVNLREAVILKSVTHPALVKLSSIEYTHKHLHITMPHVGIPLSKWVDINNDSDRMKYFSRIFKELVEVVYYLWIIGIQQLDMVPDNIMIDPIKLEKGESSVKIIDIGLCSFRIGFDKNEEGIWSDGFGTWVYCPPEIVLMDEVNDRTPSWSLGMIAAFIMTGENPIEAFMNFKHLSSRKSVSKILLEKRYTSLSNSLSLSQGFKTKEAINMFDKLVSWKQQDRMSVAALCSLIGIDISVYSHKLGVPVRCNITHVSSKLSQKIVESVLVSDNDTDNDTDNENKTDNNNDNDDDDDYEYDLNIIQKKVVSHASWLFDRVVANESNITKITTVACMAWSQILIDPLSTKIIRDLCDLYEVEPVEVSQQMLKIAEQLNWCMISLDK